LKVRIAFPEYVGLLVGANVGIIVGANVEIVEGPLEELITIAVEVKMAPVSKETEFKVDVNCPFVKDVCNLLFKVAYEAIGSEVCVVIVAVTLDLLVEENLLNSLVNLLLDW